MRCEFNLKLEEESRIFYDKEDNYLNLLLFRINMRKSQISICDKLEVFLLDKIDYKKYILNYVEELINSEIMNPKLIEIEEEMKNKEIALMIESDIITKEFINQTDYIITLNEFFMKKNEELENLHIQKQEKFVKELKNRIKLKQTQINSCWNDLPFKREAINQHINKEKKETIDQMNNLLKDINPKNYYETSLNTVLNEFISCIHNKIQEENLMAACFESAETAVMKEIEQIKTAKLKEIQEIQQKLLKDRENNKEKILVIMESIRENSLSYLKDKSHTMSVEKFGDLIKEMESNAKKSLKSQTIGLLTDNFWIDELNNELIEKISLSLAYFKVFAPYELTKCNFDSYYYATIDKNFVFFENNFKVKLIKIIKSFNFNFLNF